MFKKLKNKFINFMYGRNGADELSRFILYVSFVILIPSGFIKNNTIRFVFTMLFWCAVIYSYFRVFSKNINKRRLENKRYTDKVAYLKQRFTQRKQYKFFNCPKCKTHLRVPKGAGKITITCNKCGHQFDRKA